MDSIKVGALNCQGLKEKYETPEFVDMVKSCLVFGVCETWLRKGENTVQVENYKFYPYSRKTEGGVIRGGVGLFINEEYKKWIKVLYDISSEYCIWCKLKKEFFGFGEDLYIGMVYIPPQDSSREKRTKINHFKNICDTYASLKSEHVILMGDMNARTKDYEDVISSPGEEGGNHLPIQGLLAQQRCARNSQDQRGNKYGKKLIDLCHSTNSFIVNGRTLGDLQGKYTCYEKNGSSVVDYVIANERLSPYVDTFRVSDPSISDHCKIDLGVSLPRRVLYVGDKSLQGEARRRPKWNDECKVQLEKRLEEPETKGKMAEIGSLLAEGDCTSIDTCVDILNDIYTLQEARGSSGKKSSKKSGKKTSKKPSKKWYDRTCYETSQRLKNIGRLLAKRPSDPYLRGRFCTVRKEYRKLLKQKRWDWRKGMIERLERVEQSNPKEYWDIIKQLRERKADNTISNPDDFKAFYEKLFSLDKDRQISEEHMKIEAEVLEMLSKGGVVRSGGYSH